MSTSWADGARLCLAWRRERLPAALWVPVAATLTLASTLPLELADAWGVALLRVATAWLALGGMRLWDDLADLPHDRARHPDRALSRAAETAPAWTAAATSLLASGALVAAGQGRAPVFAGLVLALAVFYAARLHTRPVGAWLRLLKYPALVVALGGGLGARDLLALALVYAGVCHDELLQEEGAPLAPRAILAGLTALGAAAWTASWWGEGVLPVALLAATSFVVAALARSLTMRPRGSSLRTLRACLLLGTVLLFALPQTIPAC